MKSNLAEVFKKKWTVSGTVTEANTLQPLEGLTVVAMDFDHILGDDFLGKAVTDKKGKYSITFSWDKFRDILEFLPDVYVKVYDQNEKLLKDTHNEVMKNITSDIEINVEIDMSDGLDKQEVGGFEINPRAFDKATPEDILGLAQLMRGREINKETAAILEAINPKFTLAGIQDNNFCTTPFRQFIHHALLLKRSDREQWLELDRIFSLSYTGYSTNVYNTPNFSITYILNDGGPTSSDAVSSTDTTQNIVLPGTATIVGSTIGGNGIPDFVEKVGFWLEYALNKYINAPYSLRNPASGGRIPVTIENEGGPNGHATPTEFFIHNSMSDDLIAAISCHELFHMVQFQYNAWLNGGEWAPGMTEGGAVLAEDTLFDNHNRYIVQASTSGGTVHDPQNRLTDSSYRYQMALFLKYITEQHSGRINPGDEPLIGVEAYTNLITHCDAEGYTTDAIKHSIQELPYYQDFFDFGYLDAAQQDLSTHETTLGNFHLALYLKDLGTDVPDKRFDFKEDEENATWDDIFIGSNLVSTLTSVPITNDVTLPDGGSVNLSGSVNPFAAKYYIVRPAAGVSTLRVSFTATGGFTKPIFQIVQINSGGSMRDINRSDRVSYQKTIANQQAGLSLDRIVIIVSGTNVGGSFSLNVSEVVDSADVMITKWNSPVTKEYMIDSYSWSWTWGSPDVWVDNDDNGVADSDVFFNNDNHLYVRLRNKGLVAAAGVQVDFWFQDASGGLSESGWQPVRNAAMSVQSLTGINIMPGAEYIGFVNWAPAPSGTSHHFCVRVVVSSPGDPNTDNKRCTNNFGHVIAYSPYFDLAIRSTNFLKEKATIEQVIVPRIKGNLVISELDASLQRLVELYPGEVRVSKLRVVNAAVKKEFAKKNPYQSPCLEGNLSKQRPDVNGFYPVPKSILPPGAEKFDMITITHLKNGKVVGGYSYTIGFEEAKK